MSVNKCIYCDSKKVNKVSKDKYECRDCYDNFSNEDIEFAKGRKSRNKVKYTGKQRV